MHLLTRSLFSFSSSLFSFCPVWAIVGAQFNAADHPAEKALKLDVVRIYNARLDERERRKRFVIERGLVDYRKQQELDRKRPRDERYVRPSVSSIRH